MKSASDPTPHGSFATRLAALQQGLGAAAGSRTPPTLIGASKGQSEELLREAIGAGLVHFGENKVQEAEAKWPELKKAHPPVRLHLIGSLQSNKAEDAVALFDVIQTLDRPKIVQAIAAASAKLGRRPACFIQVNTGEEPQKGGVAPRDLAALVAEAKAAGLDLRGLMCVPPDGMNPAPHFALLAKLAKEHDLQELSMGMSGDYEVAARLGATFVRVGTALFGPRS